MNKGGTQTKDMDTMVLVKKIIFIIKDNMDEGLIAGNGHEAVSGVSDDNRGAWLA